MVGQPAVAYGDSVAEQEISLVICPDRSHSHDSCELLHRTDPLMLWSAIRCRCLPGSRDVDAGCAWHAESALIHPKGRHHWMNDIPVTGKTIIDSITRGLGWLDRQIEIMVGPTPRPAQTSAPAELTDVQLHHAIHDVGATLLNSHGPVLQDSFARYGAALSDRRFPAAMPTTVRSHVLMMIIQANDSYGLALLGLREHATASALGPIRNVAETYAYAKWLLESPDENVRLGRAYRLTLDAIDQLREQKRILEKVAPGSERTRQVAPMLGTAAERMSRRLTELAHEDGVTIAAKPRRSELLKQHLPDSGGYMFYSLLSNAGVHPGAGRSQAFYGRPGKAVIDFDFKGLHHIRAYWISVDIRLYLDLCNLVEPVLGWPEWKALSGQTRANLEPLAQEAQQRYLGRIQEEMANAPTWANLPSPDNHLSGTDDMTADGTRS